MQGGVLSVTVSDANSLVPVSSHCGRGLSLCDIITLVGMNRGSPLRCLLSLHLWGFTSFQCEVMTLCCVCCCTAYPINCAGSVSMLQQLRHNTSVLRLLYATDSLWPSTPTSYHIITMVVAMSLYDIVMAAASLVRTCTNHNMSQSSTSSPTAWRPICTLVPVLPTRVHPQPVSHIRFHNS